MYINMQKKASWVNLTFAVFATKYAFANIEPIPIYTPEDLLVLSFPVQKGKKRRVPYCKAKGDSATEEGHDILGRGYTSLNFNKCRDLERFSSLDAVQISPNACARTIKGTRIF
jgi:hypothetical protein